ncbi:hypothetical protein TIFTF001_015939 [Ficus carica]|uniref:Uncharacterized protein n=1 Tax=Ficus carica TaxID=3494 RepID=A0AA88A266_FICCA|nr:hypothetical protein TIFTF001_015939 [Ficus carica]
MGRGGADQPSRKLQGGGGDRKPGGGRWAIENSRGGPTKSEASEGKGRSETLGRGVGRLETWGRGGQSETQGMEGGCEPGRKLWGRGG